MRRVGRFIGLLKKYLNRETVSYLIVGGLTTVLSWGLFALGLHFGLGTVASNNIANLLAMSFAFAANKTFVFQSPSWERKRLLNEMARFFASRLLTHVLETTVLFLLVDTLGLPGVLIKGFTMAFIHVLGNYMLGKWVVFVKK